MSDSDGPRAGVFVARADGIQDGMTKSPRLADLFPRFREEDWRAVAVKSVDATGFDRLVSRSDDDLPIGPLYAQNLDGSPIFGREPGAPWARIQRIDNPDVAEAAGQIEADLAGGADGVELVFATSPAARGGGIAVTGDRDLDRLFQALGGHDTHVRIDAGEATPALAAAIASRPEPPANVQLAASFDPVAILAASGRLQRKFEETAEALAASIEQAPFHRTLVVADGRIWHAGGASEVQELAAVLATYVAYLRPFVERGIELTRATAAIDAALAADADQFLSIAKFRAARLLIGRVLETVGAGDAHCRIHAETSWRMMSRRDPHVNIVRGTAAAFAAGVGGADSVSVIPFTAAAGPANSFARRIALNSQIILIEESNIARVTDPGAGSGAVEALTAALAEAAWKRFQAIEAAGGILAVVRDGSLQREIAATREARLDEIARRQREITGVNAFPDLAPTTPASESQSVPKQAVALPAAPETAEPLVFTRLAEPFEQLRDRADRLAAAGNRPAVVLVRAGDAASTGRAATFATEALATGGLTIFDKGPAAEGAELGREAVPIACIAAPEAATPEEITALAAALRAQGAERVLLAGGGKTDRIPSGIDAKLVDGVDVVSLVKGLLDVLEAENPR